MRLLLIAILTVSPGSATTLSDVRALIDAAKRAEARQLATDWLSSVPDGPERADALNALAETWITGRAADSERVRELTDLALAVNRRNTAGLTVLAKQLSAAGDNLAAEHKLDEAISLGDPDYRTQLLRARFMMLRGDATSARTAYEKTVAAVESRYGPASRETSEALCGLADLLMAESHYAEAKSILQRAVAAGGKFGGRDLAGPLWRLAFTVYSLGDYRLSSETARRAIALMETDASGSLVDLGAAERCLAQSIEALGDYDGARAEITRAVQADEKLYGSDSMQVADDLNVFAIAAVNSGDTETAVRQFAGVLAIYTSRLGPQSIRTGGALTNLGQALVLLHRLPEAKARLESALAIQTKAAGPESNLVAQLYQKLGQLALDMGNYDEACRLLQHNLAIWQTQLGPSHPFVVNSLIFLARAFAHTTDRGAAVKTSLEASRVRREYVTSTMRKASEREALQIAGRSTTALDAAVALGGDTPADVRVVWDELIRSRALVLDQMAARYRSSQQTDAAAQRAQAGYEEVVSALTADSALVAYIRFHRVDKNAPGKDADAAYAAFVMRRGVVRLIPLGDALHIESQSAAVSREISKEREGAGHNERRNEEAFRMAGAALRRSVWDPVERSIAGSKQIYIVPDGALQLVNFNSLPTGAAGYLVESGPVIHVLTAERDLVRNAGSPKPRSGLLALGNPEFPVPPGHGGTCTPRFGALPGSGLEAAEVARFWKSLGRPAETLTHAAASGKALAAEVAGKQVVHISTHGFFLPEACKSDNPLMRSGIALSDGPLTAAQAASLPLEDAEWVVLSGCDTGLGDLRTGEGVLGLRRAFQEAGARTVIASLWPVEDDATRRWMTSLYRYRFAKQYPAAQAIRAADRESIDARRTAHLSTHPFYWAGFIAVERE
jgi:CHAT domain-containing protein/Tfp pilus assembly protein PilF